MSKTSHHVYLNGEFRPVDSAALPHSTMPFDKRVALLDSYAPDEPLGLPEEEITKYGLELISTVPTQEEEIMKYGLAVTNREKWPICVFKLRAKYPGYQPGHRHLEDMKFGRTPYGDPRLEPWVATLINHAKAKWSLAITFRKTNLQFADWILYYLGDSPLRWKGDRLDDAAAFLRKNFGMPPNPRRLNPDDPVAFGWVWKGPRRPSRGEK